MYTYNEKKEIYNIVSRLIEEKSNDSFFIKELINIINEEKNDYLIMKNQNGYYINFTKLNDNIIKEIEEFIIIKFYLTNMYYKLYKYI